MDFVGGVFLKKLVEIRTDYYTAHSANIYIYTSLRMSRTADWRKGKSGRETVREGYVMNSWIFFIVQVTTFSDIKATLHTNPIHVLTAAWSPDYCRSKRFFLANCLDVLILVFPYGDSIHIPGEQIRASICLVNLWFIAPSHNLTPKSTKGL